MVFLREVEIHGETYYYLFHTISKPSFKKFRKYIGKTKPTHEASIKNKFLEEIEKHPEKFEAKDENTIELLQRFQEKENYISEENIVKLSRELNVPATELFGIITFYSQFKLKPPGKYKISICRGTACHVKNSDQLQKFLEEHLKLKTGETTEDLKFSLESVNCIGACAKAPAMMINQVVYGELTQEKIKKILEELN